MKTIGLLGGMSWESTVSYYRAINEGIKAVLGGFHSARICLYSVDFDEIEQLQHQGKWEETAAILARGARAVEAGGADFLLICTNTMHKVAPEIEGALSIPVLHIADATAERLVADGKKRVGLLGTRFTMEQEFYKGRLKERFGLEVLVPREEQREMVHHTIYDELCRGIISGDSRRAFQMVIEDLHRRGAEAVILGCTEIALLVRQEDVSVPLYDTAALHAAKAVRAALGD